MTLLAVLSTGPLSIATAFSLSRVSGRGLTFVPGGGVGLLSTHLGVQSPVGQQKSAMRMAIADEEQDDDEGPLSKGIDSVGWLPTVNGAKGETVTSVRDGHEIVPLFPLGGLVYIPNSEHVLNIFEPRYRQMYSDILMNGSKRFVVAMSHPTEPGRFAETGVLFELQDLKEVSEQTDDKVKYICNHRVTGRVKMHRVLNPEAWATRETYLKVEGTVTDDTGKDGKIDDSAPEEEKMLRESFEALVNLQHDLEEDVRFTKASVSSLAVGPETGDTGLWQTIQLWQTYAEQRLVNRQNELQSEFQEKLLKFLTKEKGVSKDELPSAIGFNDLSPELQKEVQDLQKRMAVELEPYMIESTLTMQKILEAEDHKARCNLIRYFIDAERKRLEARKVLKGMFNAPTAPESEPITPTVEAVEEKAGEDVKENVAPPESRSLFTDEPDAFQ